MKSSLPKITISIPTYNQEKYILKAIESAISQNYENLEINISDDCSTDSTYAQCLLYSGNPKVHIFRNETNIGRNENYKKLLYKYANGEWVVNLDGDDYFTDNSFISEAVKIIQECDDVVLYHANFYDFKKFKKFYKASFSSNCKLVAGKDYVLNRCFVSFFYHLSALYKRDVAIVCGFYSYDSLNNDALSLRTIALFGDVIIDSKKVGEWQLREQSETKNLSSVLEKNKTEAANQKYISALESVLSQQELQLYFINNEIAGKRICLYQSIETKDFKKAWKLLKRDFILDLFYVKQLLKLILKRYRFGRNKAKSKKVFVSVSTMFLL